MKLAVVQPRTRLGPDEESNVKDAMRYIDEAAARGAELVMFPETYPGPWTAHRRYDPLEPLAARVAGDRYPDMSGTAVSRER